MALYRFDPVPTPSQRETLETEARNKLGINLIINEQGQTVLGSRHVRKIRNLSERKGITLKLIGALMYGRNTD